MADAENLWSTDPASALRAGPELDLATLDRSATPGWEGGKGEARAFMADRGRLLSELQERLFAHGRTGGDRSVLLIVQGLDTAGKGGIVRHVVGMVDPQGVALRAFGVPTAAERRHHYLWRVRRALPRPGLIGVFDRSHYEDVLVTRVHGTLDEDAVPRRFDEINRFERQVAASGTTIVKVALMVSYEEQGLRLMKRLDRPDKHWKYDPGDVDTRQEWDAYQAAYADVLARTSTDVAPWHVVPADRKWYSRLAVTELLTQALVDLDLGWPRPRWRLDAQKRRLAATMSAESLRQAAADAEDELASYRQAEAEFAAVVAEADASPSDGRSDLADGGGPTGTTAAPGERKGGNKASKKPAKSRNDGHKRSTDKAERSTAKTKKSPAKNSQKSGKKDGGRKSGGKKGR
ncbi:polyphosphate kinase 2 family protein [Georgenia sp. EYE_87]|uniref:PPK2 family polyphosphate kinase n=1 Tax=Georgenia sp. EYE_87 TaxID=2853448 RepID=UPI0027E28BE6|nr:PPK2 family polyphosphate kinase [Georgenia sp. EYE_87]MCK6210977.1 polyphosphate kinase 2 family protein [Georgenia sp. EYE_87]